MHLFSPCQSSCKHGFGHLAYRKGSLLASVCVRLLPTLLAGSPEGCNTSAYWGFLAQTLLCGSKNPLIGYGIFRLWKIPVPAPASSPSYIAVPCGMMDGKMVPSCTPTFRHTDLSSSLFQFLIPLSAVRITSNGLWSRLIRSISSLRTALA